MVCSRLVWKELKDVSEIIKEEGEEDDQVNPIQIPDINKML